MTLLCKDKVLSHDKTNFYWSTKTSILQLGTQVTVKRSEFFAVNHDMQY